MLALIRIEVRPEVGFRNVARRLTVDGVQRTPVQFVVRRDCQILARSVRQDAA